MLRVRGDVRMGFDGRNHWAFFEYSRYSGDRDGKFSESRTTVRFSKSREKALVRAGYLFFLYLMFRAIIICGTPPI